MLKLIIPPIAEVKDIVWDLVSVITPNADPDSIRQSVEMAEDLVLLFDEALANSITGAVLTAMLCGMICTCGDTQSIQQQRNIVYGLK